MFRFSIKQTLLVLMLSLSTFALSPAKAVDLQWLGHAAFKITTPTGKVILIDPFITKNPKTPQVYKDLEKIGKVDLVLLTHGLPDHIYCARPGSSPFIMAPIPFSREHLKS